MTLGKVCVDTFSSMAPPPSNLAFIANSLRAMNGSKTLLTETGSRFLSCFVFHFIRQTYDLQEGESPVPCAGFVTLLSNQLSLFLVYRGVFYEYIKMVKGQEQKYGVLVEKRDYNGRYRCAME